MQITTLLQRAKHGDPEAGNRIFQAVYAELRRLAHRQRRRSTPDHTLNTTALVHEAYLKLVGSDGSFWQDREHFFAVAATAMRHILADYGQRQRAAKRGGGRPDVPFDDNIAGLPFEPSAIEDALILHEALSRLEAKHPRQARVVECRCFAGLDVEETARALALSPATVKRDWALACTALGEVLDANG